MKAIELEKVYNPKKFDENISQLDKDFCIKVWNTCRNILGNLEGRNLIPVSDSDLTELDKWIFSCLNNAIKKAFDKTSCIEYFSTDFCDWYAEAIKLSFKNGDGKEKDRAISVVFNLLEESLRLIYPYFSSFVKDVYEKLPLDVIFENRKSVKEQKVLSNAVFEGNPSSFPELEFNSLRSDESASCRFNVLKDLISEIHDFRSDCGIDPASKLHVAINILSDSLTDIVKENTDLIELLAGVYKIEFTDVKPEKTLGAKSEFYEVYIFVNEGLNKEQIIAKFSKEIASESAFVQKSEAKLLSKFSQNAPVEVVQELKDKVKIKKMRIEKLQSYIDEL